MTNEEMIVAELKGISEKLTELINQGKERMNLEAKTRMTMESIFSMLPRNLEDSLAKFKEMRKMSSPSPTEPTIAPPEKSG